MSFLDSVRIRTRGIESCCGCSTEVEIGEEGTGGRTAMGGGRRLDFGEGRENDGRMVDDGRLNDVFQAGAEGGGLPRDGRDSSWS